MPYWHRLCVGKIVDSPISMKATKAIFQKIFTKKKTPKIPLDMQDIEEDKINATEESVTTNESEVPNNNTEETAVEAEMPSEVELLKAEVADLKDKYLRLYSDFDNQKRRNSKEKLELMKTANEDLMTALLPVLDDFERAQKAITPTSEIGNIVEGINLIQTKLQKTLENKGLNVMKTESGTVFNTELHEAITQFAAPSEDLKGKVIDTAEKGYFLQDKVIRFAKVIIGN